MKRLTFKKCLLLAVILIVTCFLLRLLIPTKTHRLIKAIQANDVTAVKELLDSGVDPNRTTMKPCKILELFETHAQRPLAIACDQGNLQIVQLLIDYGATAENREWTGWSPLRETLFYYHPDDPQIVKLLLEHGASRDDAEVILPVFAAAKMIPKVYDAQKTNGTVFCTDYDQETAEGITEIVFLLLQDDSINITDDYAGGTLLILASRAENIYLIERLLDLGCDVSKEDAFGKTALDYAKETKNPVTIELLETASQGIVSLEDNKHEGPTLLSPLMNPKTVPK